MYVQISLSISGSPAYRHVYIHICIYTYISTGKRLVWKGEFLVVEGRNYGGGMVTFLGMMKLK